jgi:hypothetical protein
VRTQRSRVERISGDRWSLIVDLIGPDTAFVLDVGCRGRELCNHLPATTDYVGLDLGPPADVIASAEEPLPFEDHLFETVVLADVLEHLNDPHSALDEAMRVARNSVVVLLPNIYTLVARIYFAGFGRMSSAKYLFGPEPRTDRHRWIMSFEEAASFTRGRAALNTWRVAREYAYLLPFRRRSARLAYWVARVAAGPNLWSWEYAARLEPGLSDARTEPSVRRVVGLLSAPRPRS